jgi:cystinosin
MVSDDVYEGLQQTCGWISFVVWSLSFYPQIYQNYMSKSVAGFSVEFAMLNPVGFYFYTVYNMQGYIDQKIGNTGEVDPNDIVFGVHAFALASIQLTQIFMYDRGKQPAINWYIVAFLFVEFALVITFWILEIMRPDAISQDWFTVRICGNCKIAITLIKYMP